jgi:hypothetical protein
MFRVGQWLPAVPAGAISSGASIAQHALTRVPCGVIAGPAYTREHTVPAGAIKRGPHTPVIGNQSTARYARLLLAPTHDPDNDVSELYPCTAGFSPPACINYMAHRHVSQVTLCTTCSRLCLRIARPSVINGCAPVHTHGTPVAQTWHH